MKKDPLESSRVSGVISLTILTLVALVGVGLAIYPLPRAILSSGQGWASLTVLERFQLEAALRTSMLQAVAGFFVAVGIVTGIRQLRIARFQAKAVRDAQYVEAFSRGVAQLAEKDGSSQFSGVYALDRLAESFPAESSRIVEVLCAYIRGATADSASRDAIEAALRTVSRRRLAGQSLNLRGSSLARLDCSELDLSGANLEKCDLREVWFAESKLVGADLRQADMSRSKLHGADLGNSRLDGAKLLDVEIDDRTMGLTRRP